MPQELINSLVRLARILIAQAIAFAITETASITIPWFGISLGAVISSVAKFIRDKYGWYWLPV